MGHAPGGVTKKSRPSLRKRSRVVLNPLYRALTTSRLVVEVRRPGAGPQFMADLRAFDWLLQLAEFLTVFPQGCTSGMRAELCYCRMEEPPFAVG